MERDRLSYPRAGDADDEQAAASGIGLADLDARIARAQGDAVAELADWRRAVELQDKLRYMEPPEWHYPVREALGGALLRKARPPRQRLCFARTSRSIHAMAVRCLGCWKHSRPSRKSVSTDWVKKEFTEAWKYSSASLRVEDL